MEDLKAIQQQTKSEEQERMRKVLQMRLKLSDA